jgi:hypothetical protein
MAGAGKKLQGGAKSEKTPVGSEKIQVIQSRNPLKIGSPP